MASKSGSKSRRPSGVVQKPVSSASSSTSSSVQSKTQYLYSENANSDVDKIKENVTVTVRFRPLSPREIRQGDEVSWYADGDTILRNEHNPATAYAYDRVFGPTTTTRHVYDVAAQHVVSGAMEGINGTVFAYGVTSSGKTHTMHGDQRSPGIIPLAVKDVFSIIQETPNREFLLRVSYLEIYNEVVNDLLNPAGQNLRIREDHQGTFVEGIKEEVVLSPAHALSLIAAGEEHRHVGSNNFNLLSSRSHTIFTLTIESSSCGESSEGEAVNLSQLNLIDLAGSESSKAETTGVRRKEGAYINKSLLTLGTVIAKLTDGKAAHIPYRDSKLTRLLQSSLSGHGRVSLICTVTPSSSNMEETHNTLKFAHRAKCIEVQASQNKIIDEKSLIKKYQTEIRNLKEELEQLKKGIVNVFPSKVAGQEDIVLLKQKLEDGQVMLQSRLEQEEEAKAALLGRIQRLTKLILVSTKDTPPSKVPQRAGPRRAHSFGEEELAYLPHRRRDFLVEEDNIDLYASPEGNVDSSEELSKEDKKNRKHGLLNWFKLRKRDSSLSAMTSSDGDKSSATRSSLIASPQADNGSSHLENRAYDSLIAEKNTPSRNLLLEFEHNRDSPHDNASSHQPPLRSGKFLDQIDLLREQLKILSGEVALRSSALRRLTEEATDNPKKEQLQIEIKKVNDEIRDKKQQMEALERQMVTSIQATQSKVDTSELSQSFAELAVQFNEKAFELEVKTADNRVMQEQLQQKIRECEELQERVAALKEQLSQTSEANKTMREAMTANHELNLTSKPDFIPQADISNGSLLQEQVISQVSQIEELKLKLSKMSEEKAQLEARNQKLAEDGSYAKGLASAAAVELKALSEEVTKLLRQNEKLTAEITALQNSPNRRLNSSMRNSKRDSHTKRQDLGGSLAEIKRELAVSHEKELLYEAALAEREQREAELQKRVEESKQREAHLENELANMWVLVAKLKKTQDTDDLLELGRESFDAGKYEPLGHSRRSRG
ncbi:hypothetical protein AMTRI_Chr04g243610 [Amborella trichopoda]